MIHFFVEDISFLLRKKTILREWLLQCASAEKKKIESLNFIFCSDLHLRKINKRFLSHDYFTDIITFSNTEPGDKNLSGDIYISVDRVRDNAKFYSVNINDELHRVMVHGLLHLCGYSDKLEKDQEKMRRKENSCLAKLETYYHLKQL